VLLHEEVQQLLVEGAFQQSMGANNSGAAAAPAAMPLPSLQLGAVPKSCVAFLQRLLALASPDERRVCVWNVYA
jgi:hypothetical protein